MIVAPAGRQQGCGRLGHLGLHAVEQPYPAQERLVALEPDVERHLGGADIGGIR